MKKVLLVVDSPKRDLLGIAGIVYWLIRNHGIRPVVVGTRNELSALILHCPDLILLPHVRYNRLRPALDYARAQGTALAVLPVEGLPKTVDLIPKAALGLEEYRPWINQFLSWGHYTADYVREHRSAPNATIDLVGCPRFDFHSPVYNAVFPDRQAFCRKLGLAPERPIITWFSCTAYANMAMSMDEFSRSLSDPLRAAFVAAGDMDLTAYRRDDQRVYESMKSLFARLVKDHPDCNFLVKPHPLEPAEPYKELLPLSSNVHLIGLDMDISEIIRHSDIQLNWRCSTSLEGWMYDLHKRTISVMTPGLETDFCQSDMVKGNDCVGSFDELERLVDHYLKGGAVDSQVIARREAYLLSHLSFFDGRSAERCAAAIVRFLEHWPHAHRRLANWRAIVKDYVPRWLKHRTRMVEQRDPTHLKYISADVFDGYIQQYNRIFNTSVKTSDYVLEV